MKQRIQVVIVVLAVFLLAQASFCLADGIKTRMQARMPQIDALKARGVIGEGSDGYLKYRSNDKPDPAVINAENADRRSVYQAIARKTGAAAAQVGQRRAMQIAARAAKGTWLQKGDGSWYQR